jgi:hypothetical protein
MPFTASHSAAVLPLLGTGLPVSALVIGTLTPDLPYFVPLRWGAVYPPATLGGPSHTVWALVSLDLLIGAVAWLIWHALLAAPLLAMAPHPVRARLVGRVEFGVARRLARRGDRAGVALALVVGAASHVLWDEFTHDGRWGTAHLPLATTWAGRPGYSWAQGLSTVVGALLLGVWLTRWWRRSPALPVARTRTPWLVWPVVLAAGVVAALEAALRFGPAPGMPFAAVTHAGAAMLAATMAASLLWRALPGSHRTDPAAHLTDPDPDAHLADPDAHLTGPDAHLTGPDAHLTTADRRTHHP